MLRLKSVVLAAAETDGAAASPRRSAVVRVDAAVVRPEKRTSQLSNSLLFTFDYDQPAPAGDDVSIVGGATRVLPESREEAERMFEALRLIGDAR